MSKSRRPESRDAAQGVGEECEAFLRGEWAEYRLGQGETVPPWAWLNRVAHAPEAALRMVRRGADSSDRHGDSWAEFRTCVAEALLKRADERGIDVAALQAVVLVPIELALFAVDDCRPPADEVLVAQILAALRHPSAQPGRPGA